MEKNYLKMMILVVSAVGLLVTFLFSIIPTFPKVFVLLHDSRVKVNHYCCIIASLRNQLHPLPRASSSFFIERVNVLRMSSCEKI